MAITSSAKKAQRVSERRTVFNTRTKRAMKGLIKEAGSMVTGKKAKEALALLPKVYQAVDKAMKSGVIKQGAAARIKSRLSKRIRAISA
ncbi:30S ribosomal protein S20 [Candidatus Kaiserbacteria bacterium]|nr:30S ribosomal protein S20 [Candidatus Kaiserbacteria bacterium]